MVKYDGPRSAVVTRVDTPTAGPPRSSAEIETSDAFSQFDGTQVTVSENHPLWNTARKSGKFLGDIGGEFLTTKRYTTLIGDPNVYWTGTSGGPGEGGWTTMSYTGPFLPQSPYDCSYPPVSMSSDSTLIDLGTKAIAGCSPVNPSSNVTTFLGEFVSEGIPESVGASIAKLRKFDPKKIAKAASKDFLNVEFGWLPIISDLKSIHNSLRHAQDIIDQLDRDSGKMVRRGWKFKPVTENEIIPVSNAQKAPFALDGSSLWVSLTKRPQGQVFREFSQTREIWFKGAFTYLVPPQRPNGFTSDDIARRIIQAQAVLGAGLTPDDIWNLLPWSWLVDWFSNIGDFLKNLDAMIVDNQVLMYGYMMEHVVSSYTYTLVGPYYLFAGGTGKQPPAVKMVTETKRRVVATPYGFGLTYAGLTGMQKAILAALGITKWRH